jgi:aerobic carbon-monoxide dehydrogenase large subunit
MTTHTMPAGLERRREDYTLITGHGQYVDDLRVPQGRPAALHMAVVRSPYAHAEIQGIRLDEARALPGVIGAFGAAELVESLPTLDSMPIPPGLKKTPRKPLAVQKVRYVGDPVAVVLAENLYTASDARDLVEVDYLLLPAVTDPEAALAPGAPLLYEEIASNMAFNAQSGGGDLAAALAQARHTVRLRIVNQRVAGSSMEPRACLFDFDQASGKLTAWLSSQAIFAAREMLAQFLDIDRRNIRVFNADVGGGFGTKTRFVGEEIIAAALAVRFGRPVKWIESRSENLQSQTHGRGQINYIEAAFQSDGRLLGLRVRTVADLGAFLGGTTSMVPNGTSSLLDGPYRIQAIQSQVIGALTNKVPTGAYRGAGRPEAAYILERTMERIAQELGLDPVEVRRRNLIEPEAFPYKTLTGAEYDSGNYQAALDKVVELADYQGWRAKQQERRAQHGAKLLGIGLATFVEVSGGAMGGPHAPKEAATVRIRRDGSILVQSGVASNGQGHFTAFAQIAASAFSLPGTQVEVQMNDTALPAFGFGTFGSRTLQTAGTAVHLAAVAAREKALSLAARHLEAAPADLEVANGLVSVRGVPSRAVALGELARMVEEQPDLVEHERPNPSNGAPIEGLAAWRDFSPASASFSSGAHLAVVEVDSETGDTHVLQYAAADDCGNILNHYLADAQVHGALAQGIGQALYEEALYSDDGQLLSSTLMDYTMPNAEQVPSFLTTFVETPSPLNPLGAKGIGEGGTIGAPPAIVNAVLDALAPLGIKTIDMPLRPEKVWAKIQAARAGTLDEREPTVPAIFEAQRDMQEGGSSVFV